MVEQLTDQQAIILVRDEEIRRKRVGLSYKQDVIDNLDSWLGEVMHFQKQAAEGKICATNFD